MSDLKDFTDQFGSYLGISALGATARMIMTAERYTAWGRVRAYTIAFFVAWQSYLFLQPSHIDSSYKVGIVGIASVLADDILRATVTLGQKFLKKPLEVIADYLRK